MSAGYSCLHVCHESHGGGLGLIYRNDVFVKQFSVIDAISPKLFEVQLVKITSTMPLTTVVNIYRPPHLSCTTFFEELADLIALVGADSNANILLCGDMNCPGPTVTALTTT